MVRNKLCAWGAMAALALLGTLAPAWARDARELRFSGVVRSIDRDSGRLVITTGADNWRLRATPGVVANARAGDRIVGSFTLYGRSRWVTRLDDEPPAADHDATGLPDPGVARISATLAWMGAQGSVTGHLLAIDRGEATLTLATTAGPVTLRAHPSQLHRLVPGRHVRAAYRRLGEVPWLTSLAAADAWPASARR